MIEPLRDAFSLSIFSWNDVKAAYIRMKGALLDAVEESAENVTDLYDMFERVVSILGKADDIRQGEWERPKTIIDTIEFGKNIVEEQRVLYKGLYDTYQDFCEDVKLTCKYFERTIQGKKKHVLPKDLVGDQDENGEWDVQSCWKSFRSVMIYFMDKYDHIATKFPLIAADK